MNRTLQINNLTLGDGIPKICVPVAASDRAGLEESLVPLTRIPFDMVEFRADCYAPLREACLSSAYNRTGSLGRILQDILQSIRGRLAGKPLLFTVRTVTEGGKVSLSFSEYKTLLLEAARTGLVEMVDVELFTADGNAADLTEKLHDLNVKVVGSSHDFSKTPAEAEMLRRLLAMQSLGMDITKLAVMPKNRRDVMALLHVSCEMADGLADRPYITIAMGPLGAVSRLSGSLTGSAITFASAGTSSAPGQLDASLIRRVLDALGQGTPDMCDRGM